MNILIKNVQLDMKPVDIYIRGNRIRRSWPAVTTRRLPPSGDLRAQQTSWNIRTVSVLIPMR